MNTNDKCGFMIKQLHDSLEKESNNMLRRDGLTMSQVGVLMLLDDTPGRELPLKEIEKFMKVAQSTAAGVISRLEQKELVESFGDPGDKRIKLVRLTSRGRQCCETAEENMNKAEENLLSSLTEAERKDFRILLGKIRDTIK